MHTHSALEKVRELGIGCSVNDVELGLRLRYEIKREFALPATKDNEGMRKRVDVEGIRVRTPAVEHRRWVRDMQRPTVGQVLQAFMS